MTDSIKFTKKAVTVAVVAATILWSLGLAALAPLSATAASAGSLIKGSTLSTVYYMASDGSRYAFPNEKTYFTWYSDFSGVQTLSDSELAAIPLAGNIVYRFGSRWIKIQSDPKVYAVTPQGAIRWIESEAVAVGLAGSDWNQFVDDVPDVFFTDYTLGTSLMSAASAYNGALVSSAGSTYLVWNGASRLVTSAGMTANRFQSRFILDGAGIVLSGLTAGADVSGAESTLTDTAQLGAGVTGGVTVSLASDTPAGATLPDGATGVEMMRFNLAANTGSATVTSMTFDLVGVNVAADIDGSGVFLFEGTTRLTDGKSVVASTRQVTFGGLSIALSQGQTKSLNLRVNIAPGCACAGDTIGFAIASASSLVSTATVSGSFPVRGSLFSVGTADAGDVTIETNGTIVDPFLGANGALIGQFSLDVAGENGTFKQVTFEVDDASDHVNYKLWQGTTLLSNGEYVGRKLVKFVLTNPYSIIEGNTRIFKITADVGGDAGDAIAVHLDNDLDLVVQGGDFGFNLTVDRLTYDGDSCDGADGNDDCSYSEVRGGKLTFAFNGPQTGNIQIGGNDLSILNFSITASQATTLQGMDIIITGTDLDGPTDPNFEDFKVVNVANGQVVMGPLEIAGATPETLSFTDDVLLTAGQTLDLQLLVDVTEAVAGVTDPVATTDVIDATVDMSTVDAEDANGDALPAADIVPSADITGNTFTLTDASLDVTVTSPPASSDWVKGAQGVDFVAWAFEAGDSSDITVTDVTLSGHGDNDQNGVFDEADDGASTDAPADHISTCSLYDGQTLALVDGPESFAVGAGAEILFDGFSWTIAAGDTEKLLARCNLANVDTGDDADVGNVLPDDDDFYIEIDAVGDVTATNEEGDSVDVTAGTFDGNQDTDGGGADTIDVIQTITQDGAITFAVDGDTAKDAIILGNSTAINIAKFKATATAEAFRVKKVTLENSGCSVACFDRVAANVKLSYKKQDGTTETKTAFLTGGSVTVDNLNWYVSNTTSSVLTVTSDTNIVSGGGGGATSGDQIQLNFESDGAADLEVIGLSSGETIDGTEDAGGDLLVNEMTLRKTKPTLSLASGSPSGAGVPGLGEVLRFNIAADSRGFVTLDEVTFKMTAAENGANAWNLCDLDDSVMGLDTDDFSLFDVSDLGNEIETADANWIMLESDGTACADGDGADANADPDTLDFLVLDMGAPEEIGAGTTKTFALYVDTTGANSADDDSVRFDIPKEDDVGVWAGSADPDGAIIWDDDVEGANIDGTGVKTLPVTGGTIVY